MKKAGLLLAAVFMLLAGCAQHKNRQQQNSAKAFSNGQGVTQDSIQWYQKAAEQGNTEALLRLAYLYYSGQGVTKDYTQAFQWWQKAATQGNADAQHNLGIMYAEGLGVAQDYTQAFQWFQKSAEQNNDGGQLGLGVMYENGQGVTKDINQAVEWYKKAAAQGNANAKDKLKKLGISYP